MEIAIAVVGLGVMEIDITQGSTTSYDLLCGLWTACSLEGTPSWHLAPCSVIEAVISDSMYCISL